MNEYLHVLTDPAHVLAELTYILLFDVIIGALLIPVIKRAVRRHDEKEHSGPPNRPTGTFSVDGESRTR